jgi:hypothetical protein
MQKNSEVLFCKKQLFVFYTLAYGANYSADILWTSAGSAKYVLCMHFNNRYHTKKLLNPNFHPEAHGGDKRSIFPKEQLPIVHKAILLSF